MCILEEAEYMIGSIESTFEITEDDIDPTHRFIFTGLSWTGTLNDGMRMTQAGYRAKSFQTIAVNFSVGLQALVGDDKSISVAVQSILLSSFPSFSIHLGTFALISAQNDIPIPHINMPVSLLSDIKIAVQSTLHMVWSRLYIWFSADFTPCLLKN